MGNQHLAGAMAHFHKTSRCGGYFRKYPLKYGDLFTFTSNDHRSHKVILRPGITKAMALARIGQGLPHKSGSSRSLKVTARDNAKSHRDPVERIGSYWVVSPNVRNDEATVAAWTQASIAGSAAFMGWKPGQHSIGDRFANQIVPGDVILIARRKHVRPEVVGLGIVKGRAERSIKGVKTPQRFGTARKLSKFVPISRTPGGIPLLGALKHTSALARLHPEYRAAHARVCKWMERLLSSTSKKSKDLQTKSDTELNTLEVVDSPKNKQLDYVLKSRKQIIRAGKDEARLLIAYRRWLKRQGRLLRSTMHGKLQCDGFEEAYCNLIEAKSSTRREYIRMAVGQLLDYSFEIERKFGKPNMAILLPTEPDPNSVCWLAPWKISLIWRRNGAFLDNANRQFT